MEKNILLALQMKTTTKSLQSQAVTDQGAGINEAVIIAHTKHGHGSSTEV